MTILNKAFSSARLLISFQLVLKVLNFSLGIVIARIVDPEVYGQGNIQIVLVSSAILHLSRETFRKVALKSNESPFGLMWLSVFTTWLISVITFAIWPTYTTLIICIAAMIEVLAEPFQIVHLSNLEVKGRIFADSASTICNCLIIIIFHSHGIYAFCYGQLGASIINCTSFIYFSKHSPNTFKISENDRKLTLTYLGIAIVKFFLTEGEKIFLTSMHFTSVDQGVFALVSNLCGIVCRMIFLPIEEISHLVFVKKLEKEDSVKGVRSIMNFMWILGLLIAVYSQVYADLAIEILYGKNWEGTNAGKALATYCVYVLVMGINGVTEAISTGISSLEQLANRKISMAVCFSIFVLSAYLLQDFGAVGLTLACIISMVFRIFFSLQVFFHNYDWIEIKDVLPSLNSGVSFGVAYLVLVGLSLQISGFKLILAGGVVFLVHCYFLFVENKEILNIIRSYKNA